MINVSDYIGTPYKSRGRSLDEGVDCYGLVKIYYERELDVQLSDYWYEHDWWKDDEKKNADLLMGPNEEGFVNVDESVRQVHDVLFFRVLSDVVNHMGVYVGDGKFLHSKDGQQVMCEPLDRGMGDRIHSEWRHESLA
jgi:cell wall-associated NlpC family hydrolase